MSTYQICTEGIWDTSVPGIRFDKQGVSNYATLQKKLSAAFPLNDAGRAAWEQLVRVIKAARPRNSRYDCLIGVSGGTDSSYLLYLANEYGLTPLALNLDNGWSSDISVKNIQKVTAALNIDLETYVIDYEEIKDILRSYLLAGLPWADGPTDLAIQSVLYQTAAKENLKYILIGSDFRSEGKQPTEWTYTDLRQLTYVHGRFGQTKLRTYPRMAIWNLLYRGYARGIKLISPYNYLPYQKKRAQAFLQKTYGWEYYGGHHHENLFTKFVVAYWLPRKFAIDKRRITLSAQVISGEITREHALEMISASPYAIDHMEADKDYVLKKLAISPAQFDAIWQGPNQSYLDYPSYYPLMKRMLSVAAPVLKHVLATKPKLFYELEERSR